jgi:hypothetical protein
MNKKLINSKIADLETELQKLKELANEPWPEPRRTPEAGDVWEFLDGYFCLLDDNGGNINLHNCGKVGNMKHGDFAEGCTYLGKFDEVYVKRDDFIADVRDALSIEDKDGDSVLARQSSSLPLDTQSIYVMQPAASKVLEALAKLGITAK